MRTAPRLLLLLAATVGLVAAGGTVDRSAASALTSQSPGSAHYVVRVDPRLCPSPLCGGYWVSLANHARTRCHDGLLRPRCYVASAVGKEGVPSVNLADGALARARIASRGFDGLGRLGVLVVADAFAAAGSARSAGRFFRIIDTGIRCIRAPCFSQRAGQLNRALRTTVSGVDLTTSKATPTELARAEAELRTKRGLLAQGRIVASDDGGRVLRATRVFLRSES